MEDLQDSLEEYEVNEGIPTVISRNSARMADYNMDRTQSNAPMNLMQTGPFMVQESLAPTGGDFDFTRIGIEENQTRSSLVYRRSGPEGSPAFNTSSGFLPQRTTDEESVIFRPVGQLDFSALDDTERNEDLSRNRSVSMPQKNPPQGSYLVAEREEVYGSQDMDNNNSRNDSPAAGFFEMNQSPRQSSESEEELDSRVIFSPLRKMENGDSTENISRFEFERHVVASNKFQNEEQRFHEPSLAKTSPNEMGKYSPGALQKTKYMMSPGEINVSRNQQIVSPVSPKNRPNMERREVFVSMPAVDQHRESIGTPPNAAQNTSMQHQPEIQREHVGKEQQIHTQEPKVTHVHIHSNASWDIPVSESSQQTHDKTSKHPQKTLNERRPFVSSVRSESYNAFLQSKDSHLPRPKTKGSDATKSAADTSKINTQRPENSRQVAGEKKISGPIPSHAESRIMARRNMAAGQSERQVKTDQSRKTMESMEERHSRSYQGGVKVNDHSPVHPAANVVTQVQHYHSEGEETTHTHRQVKDNVDVKGMEEVRYQLQNMLKFSAASGLGENHMDYNDNGFMQEMQSAPEMMHNPGDYSIISGKGGEDVSEILENFPSFTSKMWSESSNQSRSESSLYAENQRLREVMEKERYRRKHCEQYIQKLNVKLLETQQQLAVAISTDKRKDIMIEQLDKQLAKVVEGWKNRDEEKESMLIKLRTEKVKIEEKLAKQNEMIKNFEKDMAEALQQMRDEKDRASIEIDKLKAQISEKERARFHAEEMLDAERERTQLINQEWENLKEARDMAEKKVQQLQDRLRSEQDDWFKREQELLQKIDEVSESNQKVLNQEREKSEEAVTLCKDMEEKIYSLQTESRKYQMELDAAIREKESMKVEMGIMEAKFESSQRTLEAELQSKMEKEIADQIAEIHRKTEESETELRQNHRQQIKELNQRYTKDMERNLAKFHSDQKNREEEFRKLTLEYEEKLQEQRNEITSLHTVKQKLESQRSEILMKLQYMMQSQWNEAVQMLATTPQRKTYASTSFSSQTNTTTSAALNTSIPSQGAFPITSSPGRDSHTAPPLEPNISDLTTSLHMQQFFQSLSQPLVFPHTSMQAETSTSSRNPPAISERRVGETSQVTESLFNGVKNSSEVFHRREQEDRALHNGLQEDRVQSNTQEEEHETIHNWLRNSQEDSFRTGASFIAAEDIRSSNLSVLELVGKFQGPGPQQGSTGFLPKISDSESHPISVPVSHPPTAVPIRPPQHGNSQSTNQVNSQFVSSNRVHDRSFESAKSANQKEDQAYPGRFAQSLPVRGRSDSPTLSQQSKEEPMSWPQRNVIHSPPTKQSRGHVIEGHSVTEEGQRLDVDYHHLSQRIEEHESKQFQLQHYIQMLLQKPPGDPVTEEGEENNSMSSHNNTVDELNDTAQAAQIQKEMIRLQQLREKKQSQQAEMEPGTSGAANKVMQPEQLAEISKMLNQVKGQFGGGQKQVTLTHTEEEHMLQIFNLLKYMQSAPGHDSGGVAKPGRHSSAPSSPRSHDRDKVKRNLKDQMAGASEGQPRGDKHGGKPPLNHQKKPERKVASGSKAGHQNKSKSAWK
ncbi:uncharacterized protein LOC134271922 isoform X1 [Saccostrea cucullata]|uniref:uncharacterized protein LOC134271922 isoform X1 n=1 Tax=Saccostrea cuccullata TaxID=36930 RepID=UPI002ED573B9